MNATRRAAFAVPIAALAAMAAAIAQDAAITGTVTYRERMALPPGAVLEVDLLDISRADAAAERIAAMRIEATAQPPIPFTLTFDASRIDERKTYAVAARLLVGGRVLFRNDVAHPVLTRGAGTHAEILLRRVATPAGQAALIGPNWIAEDIGGRGVVDRLRTEITFGAEGRAFGSGGCNRFTGGYTLEGERLHFGPMASTNMACTPAAMDQEARFHAALAEIRGYRIENALLHLLDERGDALVRLARAD
ncbi:META domain-containing protein [Roseomonas eburnea]|uniref:META domain-containing protein n=1 Tax=Neoroseomonas eburnea TaxID=1346889 RepID=A0A9X9XGF6_9PROT|nr:YbaY family lipoprotein [Neoroseomonas eburnea]MBR0682792.1 META domain-containing protein [Neoroseomonas eburnea]